MNSALALVDATCRAGMAPEPQLTVSEWADRHRLLPSTSAEPGRWRTDRTPYLGGIMDALSTGSPFERVVFMKGAQVGGTEAGLNWLGYIIHHAPGLALLVMPSLDMVRRNTRTRIDPLIETTPELRKRIAPPRSRDSSNTAFAKAFPGGNLVMAGANSASGLRSTPARYLFLDEVDGFPADADGEGDPVDLAVKRTATYRGRRKIFLCSTPTIQGESRIEAAYQESDQRRYHVPCKDCGEYQPLEWRNVHWPEDDRRAAYMTCNACGSVWHERDKPALLAAGEWRAMAPGDGRTAGFHLSSLYSPFETWGEVAAEHGRVHRDPSRLQVWVNTALGETWEDRSGEAVDADALTGRREHWGEAMPPGVAILTAGVDVQNDRLEIQVIGWGQDEESWVIDYRTIWGDPSGAALWNDLDTLLLQTWPHSALPAPLPLRAVCVDTGGHHTLMAYEFVRHRLRRRVWGIKGRGGQGVPVWPRRSSRGRSGAPLFIVGVDAIKDTLAARLDVTEPGPGAIHFPASLDPAYFQQLAAERVRTKYVNGRPQRQWVPTRPGIRNEALDTFVYAQAALHGLYAAGFRLNEEAASVAAMAASKTTRPTSPRAVIRSAWLDGI